MEVQNIMTRPVQTCTTEMDLTAASRRMEDTGCGTLAVLNDRGRLAGIVTDRDLALAIGTVGEPARVTVAEIMAHRVYTCRPDDPVHTAFDTMVRHNVRRLPVVARGGDVEGMISIDDIIVWGLPGHAVSLQALTAGLRSICASSTAAARETAELDRRR
jgi:CBS domain-containing protein